MTTNISEIEIENGILSIVRKKEINGRKKETILIDLQKYESIIFGDIVIDSWIHFVEPNGNMFTVTLHKQEYHQIKNCIIILGLSEIREPIGEKYTLKNFHSDAPNWLLDFMDSKQFTTMKNGCLEWETFNGIYQIYYDSKSRTAPQLAYKGNHSPHFVIIKNPLGTQSFHEKIIMLKEYAHEHAYKLVAHGVHTPKPDVKITWEYKNNILTGFPAGFSGWINTDIGDDYIDIHYDKKNSSGEFEHEIIWDSNNFWHSIDKDDRIPKAMEIAQEWANNNR